MKIFYKEYDAHNEKTKSWNDFFKNNTHLQQYLTENVTEADMIVCAGGDGTLLKTVKQYIDYEIPIYGVNAGTLGFLMNNISQYDFVVDICERRKFDIKNLTTIKATVQEKDYYAFNEVCIGGDMSSWIEFNVESKVLPETFIGGGMIISTPQGSTGINKNNGGVIVPILSKQWVITGDKTDINLNTVVKPRKTKIKVNSRQSVTVWVDGNNCVIKDVKEVTLERGPKVQICFSDFDKFVKKRYK